VPTLSFLFLALFMVHEFEEIIFVNYWLEKHQSYPIKYDLWVSQYPAHRSVTRSALACMVGEEFGLAVLVLLGAILFNNTEVVIGLFLANMLHLVVHLVGAWRIGKWSPGSATALITLIPSVGVVGAVFLSNRLNIAAAGLAALTFLVLLLGNIILLKRNTPRIENFIAAYVRRFF